MNEERPAGAAAPIDGQARMAARDSLFLHAEVRQQGGTARLLRVRNLSATGLMAQCDFAFAEGDGVEVALRGLDPIEGRIAWIRDGRIGIAFLRPIDPKLARRPIGVSATVKRLAPAAPAIAKRRPGLRIG